MFTVEFEMDGVEIVSLDLSGKDEDVIVNIYDDGVAYIAQFNNEEEDYDIIELTYKQLREILAAMDLPAGAYSLNNG